MRWCVCVAEGIVTEGPLPLAEGEGKRPLPMPNPLDERGLEMAGALQERYGGEVYLLHVGPMSSEVKRHYLGLGVDEAVFVNGSELANLQPEQVAWVLAHVISRLQPTLVLCGERAVNGVGSGLVPAALAAFLDWPLLPAAADLRVEGEVAVAERVVERGHREVLQARLPCVVTVSEAAPLTRYSALAKAYRARVRETTLADWGLSRERVEGIAWGVEEVKRAKARPRPRKLYVPPSNLSAADRLAALLSGGVGQTGSRGGSKFFEGPPDQAAEVILEFLEKEGLLS